MRVLPTLVSANSIRSMQTVGPLGMLVRGNASRYDAASGDIAYSDHPRQRQPSDDPLLLSPSTCYAAARLSDSPSSR